MSSPLKVRNHFARTVGSLCLEALSPQHSLVGHLPIRGFGPDTCRRTNVLMIWNQCLLCRTAESQWLHLPLITKLKKDCGEVFPVAEYGFTTIPTYPSGQIGFMVCTKDATRDVKKPLRSWTPEEEVKLCRYYNSEVHKSAFVLPTFAAQALK